MSWLFSKKPSISELQEAEKRRKIRDRTNAEKTISMQKALEQALKDLGPLKEQKSYD